MPFAALGAGSYSLYSESDDSVVEAASIPVMLIFSAETNFANKRRIFGLGGAAVFGMLAYMLYARIARQRQALRRQ